MRKILVTGAGGYIGSQVVKQLLDFGADVIAADINVDSIDNRAKKIKCNVLELNGNIYEALGEPEVCLHLAWQDGFAHNALSHLSMLSSHYVFLKSLVESGTKQIAVMGSMHEIGYIEGMITETANANPLNLYGVSKHALYNSMKALLTYQSFTFQWLRGYYILGNDRSNHSIFTKLLQENDKGTEFFPFTSGMNKYDFISIEDLALEIAASVLQTEICGVIECCTGKPVSLKDKVEEFIRNNNLKIQLKYGAFKDRPYDSPVVYGDNTKIKAVLQNTLKNNALRTDKIVNLLNELE